MKLFMVKSRSYFLLRFSWRFNSVATKLGSQVYQRHFQVCVRQGPQWPYFRLFQVCVNHGPQQPYSRAGCTPKRAELIQIHQIFCHFIKGFYRSLIFVPFLWLEMAKMQFFGHFLKDFYCMTIRIVPNMGPRDLGAQDKGPNWTKFVRDISWRLLCQFSWFESHMKAFTPYMCTGFIIFTWATRYRGTSKGPMGFK